MVEMINTYHLHSCILGLCFLIKDTSIFVFKNVLQFSPKKDIMYIFELVEGFLTWFRFIKYICYFVLCVPNDCACVYFVQCKTLFKQI